LFELLFDARNNVLMTRYFGTYVTEDIVLRDNAASRFVARRGPARGIVDFSDVQAVDMPIDRLVERAQAPGVLGSERRVIVAPNDLTYGLNRVFTAHRVYVGKIEPLLVRTLAEAFEVLDLDDPKFEPVEPDPRLEAEETVVRALSAIDRAQEGTAIIDRASERQKLRAKFLRLLEAVPARPPWKHPVRSPNAITLSDVLNSTLNRAAITDNDLATRCSKCRRKTTLALCEVIAGRETKYACPNCDSLMVAFALVSSPEEKPRDGAYRVGNFQVRTTVDIHCPGATLPRSEPCR